MKSQKNTKFISVKVKTLNHSIFQILADPNDPISAIQGQIQQKTLVPIAAQRLLYRGIHLQSNRTFNNYDIGQNNIISLIANKIPSQISQNSSLRRSEVNKIRTINKQHHKYKKHMLLQQRTGGFRILQNQSIQVLTQNKNSINQLLECLNYNYANQNMPFKLFQKRKLKVGQWVDVRDLSGQWAEAQIVSQYNQYVKIHYNGWPQRMNEWIGQNSQRIMPFRSHTVQSQQCNYLSPCPKNQPSLSKSQNPAFQPQIQTLINQLSLSMDNFNKLLKDLQLIQKDSNNSNNQNYLIQNHQNQNQESLKNMSNNAQNTQNIQSNLKDIDEVELDKKQQFYTPSKQIRANDNLSNKAEDDISKCDKDDISNKSNKSFKSKRSEGLVDTQSMKSLIIDQKKRSNKIFFDSTEAQSVKSVKNNKNKEENKYYYNNQQYIIQQSDSQINDQQDNDNYVVFKKKQYKRKMKASQIAPIADRLGRLLIDLAPHFAILGYQQQSVNNFSQNLSIFTNQGSLQSKMAKAQKIATQEQQKQPILPISNTSYADALLNSKTKQITRGIKEAKQYDQLTAVIMARKKLSYLLKNKIVFKTN